MHDPIMPPADGCECPQCQGYGKELRAEPVGDHAEYVEVHCRTCEGRGWVTEQERKNYWRDYYARRNREWRRTA